MKKKGPYVAAVVLICAMILFMQKSVKTAENTVYEAENGVIRCENSEIINDASASGGKAVAFYSSDLSCEFQVRVAESGYYNIKIASKGIGSEKNNFLNMDNQQLGSFKSLNDQYSVEVAKNIYITSGTHNISITGQWGWFYLDYIQVQRADSEKEPTYQVTPELINKNATDSTKNLMALICGLYGEKVISGQNCDDGYNGSEFKAIKECTGKVPAMLGMDLMRYTPCRVEKGDNCKTIENAIEFDRQGGIVEIHWHWNAPDKYLKSGTDDNGNPRWWGGFYTNNLNIDLSKIMDGQDMEGYNLLIKDIDAIAVQLKRLSDADVPILFRPLHEASGGWFWWGSDGAEPYKKLWRLLYDRLTNQYGLNNIIWVWNGQSKDWYPGDEYVDIIGEDVYNNNYDYSPQQYTFSRAVDYSNGTNKLVAMTENGPLFDIDKAFETDCIWGWFCTWSGEFAVKDNRISTIFTAEDMWKKVYQHEKVVTLDDLGELRKKYLYPTQESTTAPEVKTTTAAVETPTTPEVTATTTVEGTSTAPEVKTTTPAQTTIKENKTSGTSGGNKNNIRQTQTVKRPGKVKIKSAKRTKNGKIQLKWRRIKKVQGYQVKIWYKRGSRKKITYYKVKKTVFYSKKTKKGKKYYVKVRAFRKNGKKIAYGKWSRKKVIKR